MRTRALARIGHYRDARWPLSLLRRSNVPSPTQNSTDLTLPEIRIIGTGQVPPPARAGASRSDGGSDAAAAQPTQPGAVDRDKIPSNVQVLSAPDFSHAVTPDLLQAMERGIPGVALSDQTGNQFQLDLNYRGFIASPVIGTPQGLAVYQNGVRINEVFGDIVNWDFIPENAISRMTLMPSNPVFGLNAIGGALSLEMKNGFTYQGVQGEVNGGSYGRIGTSVQAGGQVGSLSGYIAADAIDDAGWRTDSASVSSAPLHGSRRTRRSDRISRQLHRGRQQFRRHCRDTGPTSRSELVEHLHRSANHREPACLLQRKCNLEAERHLDLSGDRLTFAISIRPTSTATGRMRKTPGCPNPAVLCFPNLNGYVFQSGDDERPDRARDRHARLEHFGRNRPDLDDDQQLRRLAASSLFGENYSVTTITSWSG